MDSGVRRNDEMMLSPMLFQHLPEPFRMGSRHVFSLSYIASGGLWSVHDPSGADVIAERIRACARPEPESSLAVVVPAAFSGR